MKNNWWNEFLACPECGSDLSNDMQKIYCMQCSYQTRIQDQLDLMPSKAIQSNLDLPRTFNPLSVLDNIDISRPKITYFGPKAKRDSSELFSALQPYLLPDSKVLDLGCGPKDQAVPAGYLGYKYVGIDYDNRAADILADAHSIPFRSETFDCVLSYAVLEHLHNPFIAVQEIKRILKPGGVFCGTVSQGEPFHSSYFHHTVYGLISVINSSKMSIKAIWPSYDTLHALAVMGKYPRMIKYLLEAINFINIKFPFLAPRKMRLSDREKKLDELYRAASICFLIKKNGLKE